MNKFTDWIAKEKGITAPRAAPAETPKIDGSANGFLNRPCITAPDIDNARPTKNDNKILGSLISKIIEVYISLSIEFRKNNEIISELIPLHNFKDYEHLKLGKNYYNGYEVQAEFLEQKITKDIFG